MFTIEQLNEYGADTKEGLKRCMNMPDFYLRLVGMVAKDEHLAQLKEAVAAGNLEAGFEAAHALKGVLANLALTPVLKPVSEMTELLMGTDVPPRREDIRVHATDAMLDV